MKALDPFPKFINTSTVLRDHWEMLRKVKNNIEEMYFTQQNQDHPFQRRNSYHLQMYLPDNNI